MKLEPNVKDFSGNARNAAFPLTDCNYHIASMPHFHGGCVRREMLSFRKISSDYFRNEAHGEFRNELLAFSAIIVTAAVPILSNVHALADFLRAIGSL